MPFLQFFPAHFNYLDMHMYVNEVSFGIRDENGNIHAGFNNGKLIILDRLLTPEIERVVSLYKATEQAEPVEIVQNYKEHFEKE
jgi:hypothetical protein